MKCSVFSTIDGEFEDLQDYYTTPQPNNQAENAGNAREEARNHRLAQPPTSCPEPAGVSLRDDQLQEFRVEA